MIGMTWSLFQRMLRKDGKMKYELFVLCLLTVDREK